MAVISDVKGREIIDSRGNPTVEVEVLLDTGHVGRAAVPSGASTGSYEALELRDGDDRFGGKGVVRAVTSIRKEISPRVKGMDPSRQAELDAVLRELDGTPNKARLGANSLLGVSMAAARAAASYGGISLYRYLGGLSARLLPVPQMNVINGGLHADNNLDIQEFMIIPAGAQSYREALRMGAEVYQRLKAILKERGLGTNVGDEGGFSPTLENHREALDLLVESAERAGYEPGRHVYLGIDAAASEFYQEGRYRFEGKTLSSQDLVEIYVQWIERYPLISIEDGMAEEDWSGWSLLTRELGSRVQLVGDDLFATNTLRLTRGFAEGAANSLLVKVNQIGTLTEAIGALRMAHSAGYTTVVSHRSGETEDTFISDLAVGLASGQIKAGAPARSERTAKYNRLLRIEEELGSEAAFGGIAAVLRVDLDKLC